MVWRLLTLRTYLLLPVLSIILEILISPYLNFELLPMGSLTYLGPHIWSKLDRSIRSSESLGIFNSTSTRLIAQACWTFLYNN